jgi:hypothetical protein
MMRTRSRSQSLRRGRIAAILIVVLLVPAAAAFGAGVKDYAGVPVPADFKTFSDAKGKFTVSYPAGWTLDVKETMLVLAAPDNSAKLNIQVMGSEEKFEDFVNERRKGLKKYTTGFLSDGPAAFGPLEAHYWSFHLQNEQGAKPAAILIFRKGNRFFMVAYSSLMDRWEKVSAQFEQIISSIKPGD